jgi:hypothetical protein
MDSVESYLLNDAFCKENLYNCVNSFPYQIIGTKINLNQFIKSELENHILECEPKFKNQLDKAVKYNDSNKFKKLKSIFEEVSEAELQEAIKLCDKHNSKVSREFPQITLEKTGEKSNYYTLYSHSEKYDVNSKKNIIITKYLQNVSIDLLKAVNRLISYYPTTRINLSTDDYRIKSASKINSQNNPTLTFGKYNGKDILSVCKIDKNYCLWLMKQFETNKKLSAIQSKIYDIIYLINKENGWNKLNEGGQIGNTFNSLGSAKELGVTPNIDGHDMIAKCDCGENFSYQNSKKNIVWKCPECNGMKRIETDSFVDEIKSKYNLTYTENLSEKGKTFYDVSFNGDRIGMVEFHKEKNNYVEIDRIYLEKNKQKQGFGQKIIFDILRHTNSDGFILYPLDQIPWVKMGLTFIKGEYPYMTISKEEFISKNSSKL